MRAMPALKELTKAERYYLERWKKVYLAIHTLFPTLPHAVAADIAIKVVAEVAKDQRMWQIRKERRRSYER